MRTIKRRMELVARRMEALRKDRDFPLAGPDTVHGDEFWRSQRSLLAEDEILPVTCWPHSVIRH